MLSAWEDKSGYAMCIFGYSDGSKDLDGKHKVQLFEGMSHPQNSIALEEKGSINCDVQYCKDLPWVPCNAISFISQYQKYSDPGRSGQ